MLRSSFTLACLCVVLSSCDTKTKTVDACGDGFIDPAEACDGADLGQATCGSLGYYRTEGTLACRSDCTFNLDDCGGRCGDNTVDHGDGETCDGDNLDDASCLSLGYGGGALACGADCRFDLSGCTTACGNGRVEGQEGCDDGGTAPGDGCSATCAIEEGWACDDANPSVCVPVCGDGVARGPEACDGADLRGGSCEHEGYHGGTLACTNQCALDLGDCEASGRCGDGVIQGTFGEACDGAALGGQSCEGLGFYEGELACAAVTCRFDVSGCGGRCGDLIIQDGYGEVCDADLLGGATCLSQGWYGGTLACAADCRAYDETGCAPVGRCGDGVVQVAFGEACDGVLVPGQSCEGLGFDRGTLACSGDCGFDTTGCLGPFASVDVGSSHTCAVKLDGSAWCWGYNYNGQLGDGTTTSRPNPTAVSGLGSGVVELTAGVDHTCARRTDGSAWCWGNNYRGQLGDGTTTSRTVPTAVSGFASGTLQLSAGEQYTCAVKTGGALWCWGFNTNGQLGDGTTTNRTTPTALSSLASGVGSVSAGNDHTCAVKTDGTAWCWGHNNLGQVGDGTTTNRTTPTAVTALGTSVLAMATSRYLTCALRTGGAVSCWGLNDKGQVGDGTTTNRTSPTAVSGMTGATGLFAGLYFACVKKTDGSIWCWGYNLNGQVGDGTTTNRSVPTTVSGLGSGGVSVSAGGYSACARKSDDSLWCWGQNATGQLGDGSTTDRYVPVPVEY